MIGAKGEKLRRAGDLEYLDLEWFEAKGAQFAIGLDGSVYRVPGRTCEVEVRRPSLGYWMDVVGLDFPWDAAFGVFGPSQRRNLKRWCGLDALERVAVYA